MEPVGVTMEGEWSSLSGIYTNEEADFLAQMLGINACFDSCSFWSSHDHSGTHNNSSDFSNGSNFCNFSQGNSSSIYSGCSNFVFPTSSQESYHLSESHLNNNSSMSMDFCTGDVTNTASYLVEGYDCSNQEISNGNLDDFILSDQNLQPKREREMLVIEPSKEDKSNSLSEVPRKRSQSAGDTQKSKRNARFKKSKKLSNNDEESNAGLSGPASSSCWSEDDSNASHELNGGVISSMSSKGTEAANLNGKTRASRGSATDPQSLYARKRRERINERLRILQNLVPNGTKVDISTMLEEAVHYVKFLQLQIKLLSSEDLWMYAPIAYNGMDIGLDLKLTTPR